MVSALGRIKVSDPDFQHLRLFADLVDQETWIVGSYAKRTGLSFYGTRLVSDACEEKLPDDQKKFAGVVGNSRSKG